MKISKYTFIIPQEDDCTILYNCRNEALAVIESALAELLTAPLLTELSSRHKSFYDFLKDKKFIVESGIVEEEEVVADWKKIDTDKNSFSIFINPTMDCNLHCWYCFESHVKGTIINEEVFAAILKLVERKIVVERVNALALSLFGGEPLIVFDSVVLPLIRKVDELCKEYGTEFYVSFVSNGTLITKRKLEALNSLHTINPIDFQITLDGNEHSHNETKAFPNGKGSYQLVLNNIKQLLSNHMNVTLRFNMTMDNAEGYYDVLSDLQTLSKEDKKWIKIDLQHVWQDVGNFDKESFFAVQAKIRKAFLENGFMVHELKHIDNSRCYADRENNVSINYDGKLFHCTARDFIESNSEGILLPNGTFQWNEKHKKRMMVKYGNSFCKECRIYPLCHGGCSQYKLDCGEVSGCIRGYDDMYIRKIVEDRVEYLLERVIN